MRRAARTDATQGVIVRALRAAGAFVQPLHTIGRGCPDLLVAYRRRWHCIETKPLPRGKPARGGDSKAKPREAQVAWWLAADMDTVVARTVDEALKAIGAIE